MGIAGSLAGGLMEFAHAPDGAMVKKLHLGRAAESGVLAASLADGGFTGPSTVIEGKAGWLHGFADDWDTAMLTRGLGTGLRDDAYHDQTIRLPHHCAQAGGSHA